MDHVGPDLAAEPVEQLLKLLALPALFPWSMETVSSPNSAGSVLRLRLASQRKSDGRSRRRSRNLGVWRKNADFCWR
jgi:hypothetical protein